MTPEPERSLAEGTVVVGADDAARDAGWPVAELYRVDPEGDVGAQPTEDATLVLAAPTASASPRRTVPDVGIGLLAVTLAVGGLILGAVLLASRDDGRSPRAATSTTPATRPTAATGSAPTAPTDTVPNVEGLTVAAARDVLKGLDLRARVRTERSERAPGIVLRQEPARGTEAAQGDVVTLFVTAGNEPRTVVTVSVPSVVGDSASEATAELGDLGFVAKLRLVASSTGRAGVVLRQSPAAETEAARGSTVRLDVSKPRRVAPRISVPDLVGMDVADARRRLEELGLTVDVVRVASPQPAGTVLRQSPRATTRLPENGSVTLTVSSGPQKADVPDTTGLDESSARAQLEEAGFDVEVAYEPTSDAVQDGSVIRQTPDGGSAAVGSVVTIVVARLG